ncbi:hypothetical protein AV540_22870 [Brevibacillus parabrevis]|nr:hypothetical protein AV540_22870 [Brevibacillus parabrevis]
MENGDRIILNFNKAMDTTHMGTEFNIQALDGDPTMVAIDSTSSGQIAWVRTDGKHYTTGANINFTGSTGVWSDNNKTLTITLTNSDGTSATGLTADTLTLFMFGGARGADGIDGIWYESITTDSPSSF